MYNETAQTLTEEKYGFKIKVTKKKPFKKSEVKEQPYEIPSLNLFTMIRIAKEVMQIENEGLKDGKLSITSLEILSKNGDNIKNIIAFAILNKDEKPSKELMNHIGLLNSAELLSIVNVILKQMNLPAFISSIISIRSVKEIVEMNPTDQRS